MCPLRGVVRPTVCQSVRSVFALPLMLLRRARSLLLCVIAMVFISVGSTSLAYGQKFESVLQDYCIQKCAEFKLLEEHLEWQQKYFPMDNFPHTVEPPVGCTCPKVSPPGWGGAADHTAVPEPARTTLPTAVFLVSPPTSTCVLSRAVSAATVSRNRPRAVSADYYAVTLH
jgi:hypothetical protein